LSGHAITSETLLSIVSHIDVFVSGSPILVGQYCHSIIYLPASSAVCHCFISGNLTSSALAASNTDNQAHIHQAHLSVFVKPLQAFGKNQLFLIFIPNRFQYSLNLVAKFFSCLAIVFTQSFQNNHCGLTCHTGTI